MLEGSPITEEENLMEAWLGNKIFSNGLRSLDQGQCFIFFVSFFRLSGGGVIIILEIWGLFFLLNLK